ncbi:MAG: hypothetical protein H6839_14680 [Planctomycetes bacterium]|nr:hypothetical protein [Planctomycetota bacterium]
MKSTTKDLLNASLVCGIMLALLFGGIAVWEHLREGDPTEANDTTAEVNGTSPGDANSQDADLGNSIGSPDNEAPVEDVDDTPDPSDVKPPAEANGTGDVDSPTTLSPPAKGSKAWFDELRKSPKNKAEDIAFDGIQNADLQEQIRRAHASLPGGKGSSHFLLADNLLLLEAKAVQRQVHFTMHVDRELKFARNAIPRSEIGFDNYMVDPRSLTAGLSDDPREWTGGGLFDFLFVMGGYVVAALNPADGSAESGRLEAVVSVRFYTAFDTWCEITAIYPYINEGWQQITRTKSLRCRKMLIEQHLTIAVPEDEAVKLRFFGKPHDSGLSRDGLFRVPRVLKDPISGESVNEDEVAAFNKYLKIVK